MKYELDINLEVLNAQRDFLKNLDVGPDQVVLVEGLKLLCDAIAKRAAYVPVITGDELEDFVDSTVNDWDIATLIFSATTELMTYWSGPRR